MARRPASFHRDDAHPAGRAAPAGAGPIAAGPHCALATTAGRDAGQGRGHAACRRAGRARSHRFVTTASNPAAALLDDAEFDLAARLIRDYAGIKLSPHKRVMVHNRLSREVRARGLRSFSDYLALVQADAGG